MMMVGAPDQWVDLIDSMVPNILDLVTSAWKAMPPLSGDAREDPTTETLCRLLRQHRNSGDLPFRIDIQMVELDPAAGQDQGRLDIAFSPMVPREDIYFALECKRLNVGGSGGVRSYAGEYVIHGMRRFIHGQYAAVVRHGGMLAYVLDRQLDSAIENVSKAILTDTMQIGNVAAGNNARVTHTRRRSRLQRDPTHPPAQLKRFCDSSCLCRTDGTQLILGSAARRSVVQRPHSTADYAQKLPDLCVT